MMTTTEERAARELLHKLGRELFQTETSAAWHCRREAGRLGDSGPAQAMTTVADHATAVLKTLPSLAASHDMPVSGAGHALGRLLSATRQAVIDRIVDAERSYRATLLGIRHGIDVVRLLGHVAGTLGDDTLVAWCQGFLALRLELSRRAEVEPAWFAEHPGRAPLRATAAAAA